MIVIHQTKDIFLLKYTPFQGLIWSQNYTYFYYYQSFFMSFPSRSFSLASFIHIAPYHIQRHIDYYFSAVVIWFHRHLYCSLYILVINKAFQALRLQVLFCLTFYRQQSIIMLQSYFTIIKRTLSAFYTLYVPIIHHQYTLYV